MTIPIRAQSLIQLPYLSIRRQYVLSTTLYHACSVRTIKRYALTDRAKKQIDARHQLAHSAIRLHFERVAHEQARDGSKHQIINPDNAQAFVDAIQVLAKESIKRSSKIDEQVYEEVRNAKNLTDEDVYKISQAVPLMRTQDDKMLRDSLLLTLADRGIRSAIIDTIWTRFSWKGDKLSFIDTPKIKPYRKALRDLVWDQGDIFALYVEVSIIAIDNPHAAFELIQSCAPRLVLRDGLPPEYPWTMLSDVYIRQLMKAGNTDNEKTISIIQQIVKLADIGIHMGDPDAHYRKAIYQQRLHATGKPSRKSLETEHIGPTPIYKEILFHLNTAAATTHTLAAHALGVFLCTEPFIWPDSAKSSFEQPKAGTQGGIENTKSRLMRAIGLDLFKSHPIDLTPIHRDVFSTAEKRKDIAMYWFKMAEKAGHAPSCIELAKLYLVDMAKMKDKTTASRYKKMAVEHLATFWQGLQAYDIFYSLRTVQVGKATMDWNDIAYEFDKKLNEMQTVSGVSLTDELRSRILAFTLAPAKFDAWVQDKANITQLRQEMERIADDHAIDIVLDNMLLYAHK